MDTIIKGSKGKLLGIASCLREFRQAIQTIPIESLEYHLYRGDFTSWLNNVLHDKTLASLVEKAARNGTSGENLRQALFLAVASRYDELRRLT